MTFRPWFQRVRAVLELTTHSQSRRWHGVAPLAAETEQFEPRCLLAAGALDSTFGIGGEKTVDVCDRQGLDAMNFN